MNNTEIALVLNKIEAYEGASDFLNSLKSQLKTREYLSERQIAAAAKFFTPKEPIKGEQLDASELIAMFERASNNGLKRPALSFGDVRISKAPANGNNAGFLYVKKQGEYQGKVSPTGEYFAVRSADPSVAADLQDICGEPEETLRRKGRETGICVCCGQQLTNAESIELGIGPICRKKWL